MLEGAAFAQRPQLLLSPTPEIKEEAKGPAGACTPCMCTCGSSGQNVQGQSLQLLKSSEVMGGHRHSLVTSQGCRGLPPDGHPARKADTLSRGTACSAGCLLSSCGLGVAFNLRFVGFCGERLVP